jgi:hypothetical protein
MSDKPTNLGPRITGHLDEALDHTRHMLIESLSIRNIPHAVDYFVTSPNKINTDLTVQGYQHPAGEPIFYLQIVCHLVLNPP